MARTFTILGGTGAQGGATLEYLRNCDQGVRLRTLTRRGHDATIERMRAWGVDVLQGDYADPATLRRALTGIDGLFLNTTFFDRAAMRPDFDMEIRHAERIVAAARAVDVPHIVFSTSPYTGSVPHMDTKATVEALLRASGIPTSLVSTCNYMDNFLFYPMYKPILEGDTRVFRLPFPADKTLPTISVRDIGVFAGLCLLDPTRFAGSRMRISGSELTLPQMVREFCSMTGCNGVYRAFTADEWRALGWPFTGEFVAMFEWYAGAAPFTDLEASRSLHPRVESWSDWLRRTGWRGE
jgi:uncharacterized protein YbjT (DUF2867 family)